MRPARARPFEEAEIAPLTDSPDRPAPTPPAPHVPRKISAAHTRPAHALRRAQERSRLALAFGCYSFLFAGEADLAASRMVMMVFTLHAPPHRSRVGPRVSYSAIQRVMSANSRSQRIRRPVGCATAPRFRAISHTFREWQTVRISLVLRRTATFILAHPGFRAR